MELCYIVTFCIVFKRPQWLIWVLGFEEIGFLLISFICLYCYREACSSGSVSNERASALVLTISRFISSCAAEQIRLAPEKCMHLKS